MFAADNAPAVLVILTLPGALALLAGGQLVRSGHPMTDRPNWLRVLGGSLLGVLGLFAILVVLAIGTRMEAQFIVLAMSGPAVIGIGALVGGIVLLRRNRLADASVWTPLWAALLLLLALGIAGCYATVFWNGFH